MGLCGEGVKGLFPKSFMGIQETKKNNFFHLGSLVLISLFILMTSHKALAHKVNVFAYAEGDTIYTESYFPDGRRIGDAKIEVYDSQENKLLKGKTGKDGIFNFKIPKTDDLKIVLIATMGHKNSFTISADEIAEAIGTVEPVQTEKLQPSAEQTNTESAKVKQRQSRAPEKEPFPLAGVLGGLGFIFGLTALILQLTGKNKT